jgi:hypothetical protein
MIYRDVAPDLAVADQEFLAYLFRLSKRTVRRHLAGQHIAVDDDTGAPLYNVRTVGDTLAGIPARPGARRHTT